MNEKINNAAPNQAPEVIIPLPRRGFHLVPDEDKKVKEPEKIKAASVPPRRLGLKIGSSITAGIFGVAGVGIGFGENDKLPDPLQKTYDNVKAAIGIKDRITYGKDGTPVVDVTQTSKFPETTIAPTTTVEQTTTTVEATTTTEAEIINAPEIVGLSFNQETKTYIAEAGNPYGLEAGIEAGVYTAEALKVNGEMEDAIGLKPAVIGYFQKQYLKEDTFFVPIPIDLNEVKGVEIDNTDKTRGVFYYLGIKASDGTKIYAPLSTNEAAYQTGFGWSLLDFFVRGKKERSVVVEIDFPERYSLMDLKETKENFSDGAKAFELKAGELVAQINQKASSSLNEKEKAYYGDYDFFYALHKASNSNFSSELLTFDNKTIFILPNEATANAQKQS